MEQIHLVKLQIFTVFFNKFARYLLVILWYVKSFSPDVSAGSG